MLRGLPWLASLIAVTACGVTDPNVAPCGDDCPGITGSGGGGGSGAGGRGGEDGGEEAGTGEGGSGSGGNAGDAGATDGGGEGGSAADAGDSGEAGSAPDGGCDECPADLPHCAGTECVACIEDDDCDDGVCEQNACVPCREDGDCTDPAASRCAAQQCTSCVGDEHCAHIADRAACDAGECVECTGTNYDGCGRAQDGTPHICDVLARTCTTHEQGSAGLCDTCVSDAQCGAGQLCVMQYFDEVGTPEGEVEVGYFCFWSQDATEAGAPSGDCANARPYVDTRPDSESIEGAEATVCGLRVTTCNGYKDYSSKPCASVDDDATCGDARFASDGYCEMFSASMYRCTTPCLSDDDCDLGAACTSTAPKYCSLQ